MKFGDLIISGVSPLLMSVIWMQPLAREGLQLQIARTGSASHGRVRASFVLLLIISPLIIPSWSQLEAEYWSSWTFALSSSAFLVFS